ncbi:tRNA1(Val) (adenine(37)-N6)-methyltransferase [Hymenobacter sp. GOD-10R]|uniref:tRNA1(Val) (adenine(37)-N6)-methyltransferase n=1 Tax=Hymenobacter sp. GOD-10R TaxID=3093922 RepID=UPI002D79B646|nr:methyltransferase [Hymenobacter sp. GOD-10R]WRQ30441.1 methyltransferase [Hymenobacter sp. GOD-10R]
MANSYFQFKQFRIEQDQCAMKVCTDACVLGATADVASATRLLDIGTGTGLLALMVAQRNPSAYIEAVEIDEAAAAQAAANIAASPWASRLTIHAQSLRAFAATQPAAFDHILCNPPFFRNALRSPDAARTTARHTADDTLAFEEITEFAHRFLTPDGKLTVLLPPPEMQQFERAAAVASLYPVSRLVVHHRAGSKPLRHITTFSHQPQAITQQNLAIYADHAEVYSDDFQRLLSPFYLYL